MDSQPKESGSSGLFVRLVDFAEKRGVSRSEANHVLRSVLKLLRKANPRVSETTFYVAGLRGISQFARDSQRLSRLGEAGALSAREWCAKREAIAASMTMEKREQACSGVQALPEELKPVYQSLVLEGKDYSTIAQEQSTSVESVRAQVFRAKEILRGRFGQLVMSNA